MENTTQNGTATEKISLIGREIKCLDKGFVRLVDYMGSDAAIVQAARVSYGAGTKTVNEDRGLIRYLMRHAHTSPFEMVEFKFHVKLPIFIARQWIRHRTASVNEYSGRYSEMQDEFYLPDHDQVRPQSTFNKQGRANEPLPADVAGEIISIMEDTQKELYSEYQGFLAQDVARELARINLPLALYTEWYWKIDLHNLFHFLRLRIDAHAQYEIRVYGEAIGQIVKEICPLAWEAFEDYILHSQRFSRLELNALKTILNAKEFSQEELAELGLKGREAKEFLDKISSLG